MMLLAIVTLALGPWTGPSLPTTTPAAVKYKITLTGPAEKTIMLRADGLPKGWIASFCTDKACAPFRYSLQLDGRGKGVIEFQAIRTDDSAPSHVHITLRADGAAARTIDVVASSS
jgi:hypothetical protein